MSANFLDGGHLADRCGQVRTSMVQGVSKMADIVGTVSRLVRTCRPNVRQLRYIRTSMVWSGSWVSFLDGGHLADTWRTGADKSGSWVYLSWLTLWGQLADRCRRMRTSLDPVAKAAHKYSPSYYSRCLLVGDSWRTVGGQPDIWRTLVSLLDLT